MLASGSRSGAIKICDLESQKGNGRERNVRKCGGEMEICRCHLVISPGGHKTCIRAIEYFPSSNNFLGTGAVDGTAKVKTTFDGKNSSPFGF